MHSILMWLHGTTLGLSRVAWSIVTALVLLDVLCAHSKNPRINHLAGALSLLVSKVITVLGIASIPVFGSALTAVLNALIGPAVVADVETGKPVVVTPAPVEPTKPDATLPPAA